MNMLELFVRFELNAGHLEPLRLIPYVPLDSSACGYLEAARCLPLASRGNLACSLETRILAAYDRHLYRLVHCGRRRRVFRQVHQIWRFVRKR